MEYAKEHLDITFFLVYLRLYVWEKLVLSWKTGSTFLLSQWNEDVALCSAAPEGPWGHSLYALIDQLRETVLWRNHQREPRHTLPQVRLVYLSPVSVQNQYIRVLMWHTSLYDLYLLPVADWVCSKVIRIWCPVPEMCSGTTVSSLSLSLSRSCCLSSFVKKLQYVSPLCLTDCLHRLLSTSMFHELLRDIKLLNMCFYWIKFLFCVCVRW